MDIDMPMASPTSPASYPTLAPEDIRTYRRKRKASPTVDVRRVYQRTDLHLPPPLMVPRSPYALPTDLEERWQHLPHLSGPPHTARAKELPTDGELRYNAEQITVEGLLHGDYSIPRYIRLRQGSMLAEVDRWLADNGARLRDEAVTWAAAFHSKQQHWLQAYGTTIPDHCDEGYAYRGPLEWSDPHMARERAVHAADVAVELGFKYPTEDGKPARPCLGYSKYVSTGGVMRPCHSGMTGDLPCQPWGFNPALCFYCCRLLEAGGQMSEGGGVSAMAVMASNTVI